MALETEGIVLDESVLRKGITQVFHSIEKGFYLVAQEENHHLVGSLLITYEWSDWRNGVIWWMQSVYVVPDYRKQGVFRKLFSQIERLARTHPQVKALRLYVMRNNNTGQRTYQNLGMNDSGYIVFEKESSA